MSRLLLLLPLLLLPLLLPPFLPSWPVFIDGLVAWGREHPTVWQPLVLHLLYGRLSGLLAASPSSPPSPSSSPPSPSSSPRPSDRVCVVGAGPAGIHMAASLAHRGFPDVTLYERSSRVGGKTLDTLVEGVAYPLGAIWLDRRWTSYNTWASR